MRSIKWKNTIVGVGAGAVDELMEYLDATATTPRAEPFKTWKDWSRVGLFAIGHLGQAMGWFPEYAEPISTAESALLTKSLGSYIRGSMITGRAVSGRRTTARPYSTPFATHPVSGPRVVSTPIGRTYEPEFNKVGVI